MTKNTIPEVLDIDMAFSKNLLRFVRPSGPDLLKRTEQFYGWWQASRVEPGICHYFKRLSGMPTADAPVTNYYGHRSNGVNFGNQDYLGLSSHPRVLEAAHQALDQYGPHSAGSGPLQGNTELALQLQEKLGSMLNAAEVVLYPTGWGAGFGVITGFVRSRDYVLMDEFAHQCLQQGAHAATQNVAKYRHLDCGQVEERLREIRNHDARNGILVVTEGLFSMDADSPDLRTLQSICRRYQATLLVDVAHDFGAHGPAGLGSIGSQQVLGDVDIVMGSFSKTFAAIGGFVATNSKAACTYLRGYSGPYTFSNAIPPIQAAAVLTALDIIRSDEGETRRARLLANVQHLRGCLSDADLMCMGDASAIVPVLVGSEGDALIAHRNLFAKGVATNVIDFPGVPLGKARFRLQVMATHTREQIDFAVPRIVEAISEARVCGFDK